MGKIHVLFMEEKGTAAKAGWKRVAICEYLNSRKTEKDRESCAGVWCLKQNNSRILKFIIWDTGRFCSLPHDEGTGGKFAQNLLQAMPMPSSCRRTKTARWPCNLYILKLRVLQFGQHRDRENWQGERRRR